MKFLTNENMESPEVTTEAVCKYCGEHILYNNVTGRWEADNDWLSHCFREGELREAFLHVPPMKEKLEEETEPKPVPVSQPWIFPWIHQPPRPSP